MLSRGALRQLLTTRVPFPIAVCVDSGDRCAITFAKLPLVFIGILRDDIY